MRGSIKNYTEKNVDSSLISKNKIQFITAYKILMICNLNNMIIHLDA